MGNEATTAHQDAGGEPAREIGTSTVSGMSSRTLATALDALGDALAILSPIRDASGRIADFDVAWANAAWSRLHAVAAGEASRRLSACAPALAERMGRLAGVVETGSSDTLLAGTAGRWHEVTVARCDEGLILSSRDVTERIEESAARATRLVALCDVSERVAHDLKNVLMGIDIFARFVEEDATPEGKAEDLATIREEVNRGSRLARQMMRFAGPAADQGRLDVTASVGALSPLYRLLLASPILGVPLDLVVRQAGVPLPVRIDEPSLEQVLLALLLQARLAIASGSVTLTTDAVDLDDATAQAAGVRQGGYARLTIAVAGQAVDPAAPPRLFMPGTDASRAAAEVGIAIAAIPRIVAAAGGTATVYDGRSHEATQTILLPIERDPDTTA